MLRDFGPQKNSRIYSAMRGPDIYDSLIPDYCYRALCRLKDSITGRLRALCYGKGSWPSGISPFQSIDAMDEIEYWKVVEAIFTIRASSKRLKPFATWHYIIHLREAVVYTQEENIWGGFGERLSRVLYA